MANLTERIRFFYRHYIYKKWYDKFIMLSYVKKREEIRKYGQNFSIDNFVETGTFMGDTVEFLKNDFKNIWSIELEPNLAAKAKERFKDANHIKILEGDSSEVLKSIVPIDGPTLFWLDGHYSSSFSINDQKINTAKGSKETPILEELSIILEEGLNQNVILIDDARCFNGTNDYPTVAQLKKHLENLIDRNFRLSIKNDIIRIVNGS